MIKNTFNFNKIYIGVNASKHFQDRLKNRLRLRSQSARVKFIRKAGELSLSLKDINQDQFKDFYDYMKIKINKVKRKNNCSRLLYYLDYFILVSCEGILITIYEVEDQFKGYFRRIYNSRVNCNNFDYDYNDNINLEELKIG